MAEWFSVAEWLQLAASVKSIDIDIVQHDPGFGYCSGADEYTLARETLLKEFVTDLTIFNFVWGALESALNIINPPKHPDKAKRGKIRNACYFLESYFRHKLALPYLPEETGKFRVSAQACFGYQSVEERFKKAAEIGLPGAGLFGVYELRNSFAHGSLVFPQPDDENRPISSQSIMVVHATRVVLISLQMLLLAYFKESDELISFSWNRCDSCEEYPLSLVLRGCHMANNDEDTQLSLLDDA